MKRIVCTILASLLLATAFVSCGENGIEHTVEHSTACEESDISESSELNWESIYADTINAYKKLIKDRMLDLDFDDSMSCFPDMDQEIEISLHSLFANYGSAYDGYCIKDINGDDISELIFLGSNYWVQGLCTYVNGKVKFVKEFGKNGNGGVIDKYGNIYDSQCGRYLTWFESIQALESNGELKDIIYYGSRTTEDLYVTEFFKKVNDESIPATKEEIEEFRKQYFQYGTPGVGDDWINMTKEHLTFTSFYDFENINSNSSSITDFSGTYDDMGQPIIYVRPWDEYFSIPIAYGIHENGGVMPFYGNYFCSALTSDTTGVLFAKQAGQDTKIDMIAFTKGSDQHTVQTIDISLTEGSFGIYELFCNFIDSQTGFLFIFDTVLGFGQGGEQLLLYKTEDGGKTWTPRQCDNELAISLRQSATFAKFLNDEIGIVSCGYGWTDYIEQRSYVTFDGGKIWESIAPLPHPKYEDGICSELRSIDQIDGKYIMTVKVVINGDGINSREEILKYTSYDLRSWELEGLPENAVHFSSYNAVLYMYSIIAKNAMTYNEQTNYKGMFRFNSELDEEWYNKLSNAALTLRPEEIMSYGYQYIDINKDGIDELILTTNDDYSILAIFTLSNGKPVLLDAFWNRYHGHIDSDGLLHTGGSSGWDRSISRVYRLPSGSDKLELIAEIGSDGHIDDKIIFYKLDNGEKVSISKEEYLALLNSASFSNETFKFYPTRLFENDPIQNGEADNCKG